MCMEKFVGLGRDHVEQYHRRTGNAAFLHIRRKKVPAKEEEGKEGKDEIPEKVSKMAIGVPGGFDVGKKKFDYEYTYQVAVLPEFKYYPIGAASDLVFGRCHDQVQNVFYVSDSSELPLAVQMSAKSIIKAESALKMEQLKAQSGEYTFRVREWSLDVYCSKNRLLKRPATEVASF